ncbi:MAG: SRPBCC domain-containing protein [Devosia sp.]
MTAVETRTVVVERELAGPPEKIWRALTQPHLIEEWLMKSDFRPVEGHKFTLRNEPRPNVNVVVDCEVVTVEPNRTLSYTWSAFGLESVVTFTLTPTGTGTILRVEQTGFRPDQERAYKGAKAAWRQFLAALAQVIERPD